MFLVADDGQLKRLLHAQSASLAGPVEPVLTLLSLTSSSKADLAKWNNSQELTGVVASAYYQCEDARF